MTAGILEDVLVAPDADAHSAGRRARPRIPRSAPLLVSPVPRRLKSQALLSGADQLNCWELSLELKRVPLTLSVDRRNSGSVRKN
jgi:hypothetical protein